jgi:hypothetical protein
MNARAIWENRPAALAIGSRFAAGTAHRTEYFVQIHPPRTGLLARTFQQRLDRFKLVATDIAWVTFPHSIDLA